MENKTPQSVQKEEWRDTLGDLLQPLLDIADEERDIKHWNDDVNEIFKFVDRISASVREETLLEADRKIRGHAAGAHTLEYKNACIKVLSILSALQKLSD